ncbi:MAG: hypothetical protein MI723_04755 [Caulobacterales bacterium]|nr:hypothetical protein [Caulobacterales bacterium]
MRGGAGALIVVLICSGLGNPRLAGAHAQTAAAPLARSGAPLTTLEVSPLQQSTEEYAREWRRARRAASACGSNKEYQDSLETVANALISQKLLQRRAMGFEDSVQVERRGLLRRERVRTNTELCRRIGALLFSINGEFLSVVGAGGVPPIYRAPRLE